VSNVVFFDGVDDTVNCGGGGSLNLNAAFTIEVLMKRTSQPLVTHEILGRWGGGNGYILFFNAQRPSMYLNGAADYANNAIFPLGVWTRIGFTWTAGGNLRAFKNGTLTDTLAVFAACGDSGGNFLISGTFGAFSPLPGNIAQIAIYNRVLTNDEILYNFMHPGNPIKRGIQLNLTQDSIQGVQWLDLSGNNNHGTYVGGAVPQVANLLAGR